MINRIDKRFAYRIMKLCGFSFRNRGQAKALDVILSNTSIILQTHRRCGKSWIASFVASLYILLGKTVIVAAPSQEQAAGIISDEVKNITNIIASNIGGLYQIKDGDTHKLWSNGGRILAMSGREQTKTKEGYGADLLLIDEAHRTTEDAIFPIFLPMLDDSFIQGIGKVIILG